MEWKKIKGTQLEEPLEIDMTSSKKYAYIRRNIERKTTKDELGNDNQYWEYDEAKLTHKEFELYMIEKNRSDIDYIMAMSDIE